MQLNDIEQTVYAVSCNERGAFSIEKLSYLLGYNSELIIAVLESLNKKGYIKWNNKESNKIIINTDKQ
jgi:hypothetical protein